MTVASPASVVGTVNSYPSSVRGTSTRIGIALPVSSASQHPFFWHTVEMRP
nr:hypothetical protein [Salinibacter ruber]